MKRKIMIKEKKIKKIVKKNKIHLIQIVIILAIKKKKIYLKKEKKNVKKFKEEEDLLNDEELFGIKSYGEMEDI